MLKRKSRKKLMILAICLLMLKLSWATDYLSIANKEAQQQGWTEPIVSEYQTTSANYWIFNEDAYNYFLIYGLTLQELEPKKEPLLKWYEVLAIGFITGYITNDAIN
jgi:hypothetical protein